MMWQLHACRPAPDLCTAANMPCCAAHMLMQLEAMHLELSTLRADNREAAAAARKARKRAQQDCEAAIGEFDAEMGARHKEYEQALTAYNELQEQIKVGWVQGLHFEMCFGAVEQLGVSCGRLQGVQRAAGADQVGA